MEVRQAGGNTYPERTDDSLFSLGSAAIVLSVVPRGRERERVRDFQAFKKEVQRTLTSAYSRRCHSNSLFQSDLPVVCVATSLQRQES